MFGLFADKCHCPLRSAPMASEVFTYVLAFLHHIELPSFLNVWVSEERAFTLSSLDHAEAAEVLSWNCTILNRPQSCRKLNWRTCSCTGSPLCCTSVRGAFGDTPFRAGERGRLELQRREEHCRRI